MEKVSESPLSVVSPPSELQQTQAQLQQLIAWHQLHHPHQATIWGELVNLEKKLAVPVWRVVLLGQVSRGKSALINALLGQPQFLTGPLHGVTPWPHSVRWQFLLDGNSYALDLTDTPGLDEVDGETRAAMAWEVAQQSDLVLFVTAGPLNPLELSALARLQTLKLPVFLISNKQDLYPAWSNTDLEHQLRQAGFGAAISRDNIILVSAAPAGNAETQVNPPAVDPLILKLGHWLQHQAVSSRCLQVLNQAQEIEKNLGTALLAQSLPNQSLVGVLLLGLSISLFPWIWVDGLVGLLGSFGWVRFCCKFYGIPLTPPASGQVWQKILWITLGLVLTGEIGMLGGFSESAWGGIGLGLTQLGFGAWGLYALTGILHRHVQAGYPLTIPGLEAALPEQSVTMGLPEPATLTQANASQFTD